LKKGKFKSLNVPERYFIELRWDKERVRIFSDNNGDVLSNITRANDLITEIRQKIKKNEFSPDQYRAQDYRKLQFNVYAQRWLWKVNNYLLPKFKTKDLRKFINADVDNLYLELPKKLGKDRQRAIINTLRKMFTDAVEDNYIRIEQMPKFPKIDVDEPETNWLTVEDQERIYEKIPDVHKPIFAFIMHIACRCGEARAVQVEDVDLKKRTVRICRTFSLNTLRKKTKGKKDRILPLDDELFEILKGMDKVSGFVFTHTNGNYYTHSTISRIWNKAIMDAEVKYVCIHEWGRHSFATQTIERGGDIYALQKWLGHSKIKTTERYINSVTEALKIIQRPAKVIKMDAKKGAGRTLGL